MDPPTLDERAREEIQREQTDHVERLAMVGQLGQGDRSLFEDAEHCRHYARLRRIFHDLAERRPGTT